MRRQPLITLLLLLLLLPLLVVACRRDEEEPTPTTVPTAAVVDEPTATSEPRPTATEAAPTATAPEVVSTIDPADIDWAPQVIYTSPAPGEEALLDGAITVRFDQPMDRDSVESAFSVSDAEDAASRTAVGGEFEWPREDTVVFTPRASLNRSQRYLVRIDSAARSQNGEPLQDPFERQFQTAGALQVAQLIPGDGVGDVAPDASITVLFNRPVVPLVSTAQQADLPQPLQIEPDVEGSGQWVSTSIYRFTPDEGFAGDTTYEVTIPAGLEGVAGGLLEEDVSWRFTTAQPSVGVIEPETGRDDVLPTAPMTVTFNMPMDRASVESAIALDPPAPLTFEWSEDSTRVTARPDGLLELGAQYTLSVGQEALSAAGGSNLDRETTTIFETVPFPGVVNVIPEPDQEAEPYQYGISLEFASPMDPDTIEGRVQISPAPAREPDYFLGRDSRYVNIAFRLERNTQYQVTIPADVADPYGNTLGEPYTWTFTTPPLPPLASLNLPRNLAQLSTAFPSEVTVLYRNVEAVDVGLYEVEVPAIALLQTGRVEEFNTSRQPLRTWSLPGDAGLDQVGQTVLDLSDDGQPLPTGVYFLMADADEVSRDYRWWQNQRVLLVVGDTNLVVKETFGGVHVWATDLASGEPAADIELTLYDNNVMPTGTATTNENGFATFEYTPREEFLSGVLVVGGEPGESGFGVGASTWQQGVGPWDFGVPAAGNDEQQQFAYIYTDRPIYRPGDTVHFRGILRDSSYARYNLPQREDIPVRVEFASFYEPERPLEYADVLALNENGAFDGEFTIPENAELGQYRIYLTDERNIAGNSRMFTVAQYRTPEFTVSVTPEQEEVLRGETVDVVVEANYLFGAPASDLPVQWTVRQMPYHLPWDGPYYSFDDDDTFYFRYGDQMDFFGQFVTEGTGRTDADGRLVITLPADLLEEAEDGSRTVTVEATIRDVSEFPVSASGQVAMHAADTYAGVAPDQYINSAGNETAVNLITVDWDREPVADQDVEVVFYRRVYEYVEDEQFGSIMGRWEPQDTEVDRTEVTTDGDGEAQAAFVPEEGGTYRALATVTDGAGRTHSSSTLFWVSDVDFVGWRDNPEEKRMDLTPDQRTYEVGDTAQILVQSPFEGPVNAWLTIERGTLLEQQLITLESNSEVLEIPITESLSPNAFVSVVAMKGAGSGEDPYADIRMGLTELVVPPDPFTLDVSLMPRDEQLSPGESVTYDIRVTDYAGNPVQAELSLSLVDLAVLTLKEDNAPHIVDAFYERQPYRSNVGSGLFVRGEGLEVDVPQEQLGLGGGGGGGDIAEDAARALEDEDDVRRDFPDTAYWEASLSTDENGEATVEIPLPDSTTTWRLSSKAVTADSLVGQNSVDVVASLPLLLRPVTPRFFTVNDVVQIGAIVNNNTGQSLDVTVSLEADGVTLSGDAEQQVTVRTNSQQLLRWEVTAEDVTHADLTFRAEGGEYSDATKPTFGVGPDQLIPVYRFDAEDIVGTSGVLDEAGRQVEAVLLPPQVDQREGSVEVSMSASLGAALVEALDVLDEPPIAEACAHEVVNQFLPNLATARALDELGLENRAIASRLETLVPQAIERLDALQMGDGGWGWCFSNESDEFLTAYVLFGLAKAQQAGYEVEGIRVTQALTHLAIRNPENYSTATSANRQAWYLYVRAELGEADLADVEALFEEHRDILDPHATAYLALAYELLGEHDSNNQQALLSDLNNQAIVSATGAHWEDAERDWQNLSSNIRGTAVVIDALARIDPENVNGPPAVRWLMAARTATHWTTPFETAWSILALTDWMTATGELEADYDYALNVNGRELQSGQFDQDSIMDVAEQSVPMRNLVTDDANYFIFERGEGPGRLYYTTHLDAFVNADAVEAVSRGITVERVYYDAECDPEEETCEPLTSIEAGQRVRVELTVVAPNDLVYVRVEDPLPAGAEAVDPGLATSASGLGGQITPEQGEYRWGFWGWWFFNHIEYRDEKVVFLSNQLPAGTYQYSYYLETPIPGDYQVRPAVAYEEFFPEVFGRSDGLRFEIEE
ncbi:MAG TPA: Ig-like domain-containing protein [Candidatus Sulfomarinibacteraceae bacterium]|nr:Ig-like domain-containing protein [Candidatus Sulfomarinibacteraceae bacterium]